LLVGDGGRLEILVAGKKKRLVHVRPGKGVNVPQQKYASWEKKRGSWLNKKGFPKRLKRPWEKNPKVTEERIGRTRGGDPSAR